jgi:hypothetical protein
MRMGNYFLPGGLRPTVMSAKRSEFRVGHPTVVPTNFTPEQDDEPADPERSA